MLGGRTFRQQQDLARMRGSHSQLILVPLREVVCNTATIAFALPKKSAALS